MLYSSLAPLCCALCFTYDACLLDFAGVTEFGRLTERLLGQLASGREEERDGTVAACKQRLFVDVNNGGKDAIDIDRDARPWKIR